MKHIQGFTLVEAIVTGIIAGVVGIILVTIIGLYGRATDEGIAQSRMKMQMEGFIQQLSTDVRRSDSVLASNRSKPMPDSTNEIWLDSAGLTICAYKVVNGTLFYAAAQNPATTMPGTYLEFTVGKDTVRFDPIFFPFNPSSDYKAVTIRAVPQITYKGKVYTDQRYGGTYRCRNKV